MQVAMAGESDNQVLYQLPLSDQLVPLNELIGKSIKLHYTGAIQCNHCGRNTKKSFNQGYCYPCFTKLAQCDTCIMSPEKCHYEHGTCREPEWGEANCMIDHVVYLANSSGIKVGITRGTQVPTRWIDQGAIQALPIYRVSTRRLSGLVEVVFKNHVADKTNWRKMLKGDVEFIDLVAEKNRLQQECAASIAELQQQYGLQAIQSIDDAQAYEFDFPVAEFPSKVISLNFDKQPLIEGVLKGIKGQYLILDVGVLNIRKFGAYHIEFSTH
ncbi:DUF2797 domain-containing protein [Oceanicoccus sp. KOV_DT_Chl]|uniref:DUF2797 domain-containing protein n=1 Tax=Oceanicoccus sp. KOV_DT_Chl TaxID=1904639 RepID=UPI001F1FD3D0|nr:DUF2797 domain-containing protein [Oceanicoccus sp. KOV_DT_Chl]